jgi:hypothetical protein
LAQAAAKPPAVARKVVGNRSAGSVKVVEFGPMFMARLNSTKPRMTICGRAMSVAGRPDAQPRTSMPPAMPKKPSTCMRMAPTRGTSQMPMRKPRSRNRSTSPLARPTCTSR